MTNRVESVVGERLRVHTGVERCVKCRYWRTPTLFCTYINRPFVTTCSLSRSRVRHSWLFSLPLTEETPRKPIPSLVLTSHPGPVHFCYRTRPRDVSLPCRTPVHPSRPSRPDRTSSFLVHPTSTVTHSFPPWESSVTRTYPRTHTWSTVYIRKTNYLFKL